MKRLTELWCALTNELGFQLCVNMTKDIQTVLRRVETEGFSFLTITLPTFASDLESALEIGRIAPSLFRAFRKRGPIPALLQGMTERIFDKTTGVLLDNPDVVSIWAVRQICLFLKKVELDCTPARVAAAKELYVTTDDEMQHWNNTFMNEGVDIRLKRIFSMLYWRVFRDLAKDIDTFNLKPSHGPGSTADRKLGNLKYEQTEWPVRFEDGSLFPYGEYVLPRHGALWEGDNPYPGVSFIAPEQERPVKVISVPKTLSTPRIIAVEPTCMMYMQQGLANSLSKLLARDRHVGPLLDISDQEPNRNLARLGSLKGELATLDLSEASDRVSYELVRQLVTFVSPTCWEAMDATRSTRASVDGSVRRINKFASMGSALTFPVEAMVFLAIVLLSIEESRGHRLSDSDIHSLAGSLRVYGDDIICPVDVAHSTMSKLETFGLKVNMKKSFYRGKFRESCGADYFDGELITPVRARTVLPSTRRDVDQISTWVSTMNQMYFSGLWKTSEVVRRNLEGLLGPLPVLPTESGGLGLHSVFPSSSDDMCPRLHVPRVKAWVARPVIPRREIEGYWALRKCFDGDYRDPLYSSHLTHSGRAAGAKLIQRWVEVESFTS